jgi:hypothetical protein
MLQTSTSSSASSEAVHHGRAVHDPAVDGRAPGRKTLVLFSEGLPASPALEANLQAVVEAANRANITVYAIDASGLRAVSGTLETRREIEEAARSGCGSSSSAMLHRPADHAAGRAHRRTLMKLDSHAGLARLANDTGRLPGQRDQQPPRRCGASTKTPGFHYLLTYVPKNLELRRPVPRHRREGEAPGRGVSRNATARCPDADRAGARPRRPGDRALIRPSCRTASVRPP